MSVECFSDANGRFHQVSCPISQTCCDGECCEREDLYPIYTHWYFWMAVVVLFLFLVATIVSGYCYNCRTPSCHVMYKLGLEERMRLTDCAWLWSLDEDKGPCHFLGVQREKEIPRKSKTSESSSSADWHHIAEAPQVASLSTVNSKTLHESNQRLNLNSPDLQKRDDNFVPVTTHPSSRAPDATHPNFMEQYTPLVAPVSANRYPTLEETCLPLDATEDIGVSCNISTEKALELNIDLKNTEKDTCVVICNG